MSMGRRELREFLGRGSRNPRRDPMRKRRRSRGSCARGRRRSRLKERRETRRLDASWSSEGRREWQVERDSGGSCSERRDLSGKIKHEGREEREGQTFSFVRVKEKILRHPTDGKAKIEREQIARKRKTELT